MSQGHQHGLVTVYLNGALMVFGLGLVLTVCFCSTDCVTCTISGKNPFPKGQWGDQNTSVYFQMLPEAHYESCLRTTVLTVQSSHLVVSNSL